jgi:hypothetical protein
MDKIATFSVTDKLIFNITRERERIKNCRGKKDGLPDWICDILEGICDAIEDGDPDKFSELVDRGGEWNDIDECRIGEYFPMIVHKIGDVHMLGKDIKSEGVTDRKKSERTKDFWDE